MRDPGLMCISMSAVDAATQMQHNEPMKTALLPQVRVEPKLRADVESVLNEGETLSEFVEATVRSAVEFRRMQMEFQARADAAWKRFQKTGKARPAEEVVAALQSKLDARRRELQGKHRPADA
jgi:predicted transcriptional regulator